MLLASSESANDVRAVKVCAGLHAVVMPLFYTRTFRP